jgi:undecaprenyl-diphosphatase
MLSYVHALILGVVEGLTEFLPISSTGHMVLASALLRIPETEFVKSFEIIIQLGAILAVVIVYLKRLFSWELIKRLFVAFLPTGILGLIFYKIIKTYLLGNVTVVVASLFIGGVILLVFERGVAKKNVLIPEGEAVKEIETISYRDAFIIGLCQSVAMIPGVSRSAATIVGAMLLGHDRKVAVEFSFLLAIPTMLAATGLDVIKNYHSFNSSEAGILVFGFGVAAIMAFIAVKWLLKYVRSHTFKPFGIYRIILAVVVWLGLR